jgi:DNA end-binding protein Ku
MSLRSSALRLLAAARPIPQIPTARPGPPVRPGTKTRNIRWGAEELLKTLEIAMAPRAYWKGSLKLSLVTCPVALYPATTSVEKTHFHMINKQTGNRLKQQMVDAETGDRVEGDQKARGYELRKGKYVEIERDELEAVEIESTHTIDIDSFVPEPEIDKRYLDHPYYIVPDGKAGVDAFAVIRDAMRNKDRVALARIVLTNREHVIAIEPLGKGLLGTTLRYPYEMRDENEFFDGIKNRKISKDMIELASHILDTKAAHFDASKFKDEYEVALKALVRRKAAGKPVKVAEPEERPSNVINLMDALKQSLKDRASAKRTAPARRARSHPRIARKSQRSARQRKAG